MTLDLDFSQAPCSTPLQSAEVKKSILPPPSSFLRVLESKSPARSPSERPHHNHSQVTSILGISFLCRLSNVSKKRTRERTHPTKQPQAPRKSCLKFLPRDTSVTLSPESANAPQRPCIPLPPVLGLNHPQTPEGMRRERTKQSKRCKVCRTGLRNADE